MGDELQHQSFPGDEHAGDGERVTALEEVCRVEQLVVADLKGALYLVLVAAGGRVVERGVQGGQAVEVAAGGPASRMRTLSPTRASSTSGRCSTSNGPGRPPAK
ncbi:hypothetical protein GCM10010377_76170 [Streptomyces viridiviolaceus]|nr:hypothetical protein GCM10010377_76170 [Streptomyces viridiviolaceus]